MSEFKFVKEFQCDCGHIHKTMVDDVIIGKGVLTKIPEVVNRYHAKKVFLYSDVNTEKAAGEKVTEILKEAGIAFTKFVYSESPRPDEKGVGELMENFDPSCDFLLGVGSGVLNDIGKILAKIAKIPFAIVGTAPSMDGYASESSSMIRAGLKISLSYGCANVIIGDVDVLKNAPLKMLKSGLGDMLAKYISIGEWKISNMLTGEYYCEKIAQMIRDAVQKCVDNADGLLKRKEEAVQAVFEGLVIGGIGMAYAGISRPASGNEHYISHVWDIRSLQFGTVEEFHGIQCAIGTYITAGLYDKLKKLSPDREKALAYVAKFDAEKWNETLREFLKDAALPMIALEKKEQKYNKEAHKERLEKIIRLWPELLAVMEKEIPSQDFIRNLLDRIEAPKSAGEIGMDEKDVPMTLKTSKDIRDKYVLSRLLWDLGLLDELADEL